MSGPNVEEFLAEVVGNDVGLMMILMDLVNTLRDELGDSPERWEGVKVVCNLVVPAFADYFGHNLLHSKRQPPKPGEVKSFAYILAVLNAVVRDGP